MKDWVKSSYSLKFLKLNIHNLVFSVTDHRPGISKTSILSQKCNVWCLWNTVDTFKTSGFKVDFHTYNGLHSFRTTFKVLTPTTRNGLISVISPWFYSTPNASVIEPWLMKHLRWCHLVQVRRRKQSAIWHRTAVWHGHPGFQMCSWPVPSFFPTASLRWET